jgi:hypothetical protein
VAFYQGRVKEMVYKQHEKDQKKKSKEYMPDGNCAESGVYSVENCQVRND